MKRNSLYIAACSLVLCAIVLSGCSTEISTKNLSKNPERTAAQSAVSESKKAGASKDAPAQSGATQTQKTTSKTNPQKTSIKKQSQKSATSSAKDTAKKNTSTATSKKTTQPSTSTQQTIQTNDSKISVSLSIDCKTAVDGGYKEALALTKTGTLAQKTLSLKKGASVYDALKASGCSVGSESTAMGVYIYSISSLAEKACGSKSGWLYSVNGSFMSKSSDSYILKNGDSIRWRYTCDGGKDV